MKATSSKPVFLLFTVAMIPLLLFLWSCSAKNKIAGVDEKPLVADAGPDQSTFVGSYVVMDAGESQGAVTWYQWTADEANPVKVTTLSGDNFSKQIFGFVKEGVYKFYLQAKNGEQVSKPDEVVVNVEPGKNSVFEDPALEIAVRVALKIPEGELTDERLADLDSLMFFYDYRVTSLKGIEHCRNLTRLNMKLQRIADISPLKSLTKLRWLEIDQNLHISDISPLSYLSELTHLDIETNSIADLSPLANLTKLADLRMMYNPVTDISPLRDLTMLEVLFIDNVKVKDLSLLSRLTRMKQLWFTDSQVSDLSHLKDMKELRYLCLEGNQIKDISVLANFKSLEKLLLVDNKVSDLTPLQELPNLGVLKIWDNKVADILPLLNNPGISRRGYIGICGNPLNKKSIEEYIPQLRERGAHVHWP